MCRSDLLCSHRGCCLCFDVSGLVWSPIYPQPPHSTLEYVNLDSHNAVFIANHHPSSCNTSTDSEDGDAKPSFWQLVRWLMYFWICAFESVLLNVFCRMWIIECVLLKVCYWMSADVKPWCEGYVAWFVLFVHLLAPFTFISQPDIDGSALESWGVSKSPGKIGWSCPDIQTHSAGRSEGATTHKQICLMHLFVTIGLEIEDQFLNPTAPDWSFFRLIRRAARHMILEHCG